MVYLVLPRVELVGVDTLRYEARRRITCHAPRDALDIEADTHTHMNTQTQDAYQTQTHLQQDQWSCHFGTRFDLAFLFVSKWAEVLGAVAPRASC